MIKDIVVNLPVRGTDVVTRFAASMAGYFNAHLTGVAFLYEPVMPGAEIGAVLPTSFIDDQMAEAKKCAQDAINRFQFEVRLENISSATRQIEATPDAAPGKFAQTAHDFDVAVVGQPNPDEQSSFGDLMIEAALFESGRPTMVVPYIQAKNFRIDRVAICWDGSRTATRAIADALPILQRAGSIDLVSIYGENADQAEYNAAGMVDHLSRHGIKSAIKTFPMAVDVAPSILNFAADNEIDLLVMGGYGHSRFREFILGGATRGILQSMTVPTLMSH